MDTTDAGDLAALKAQRCNVPGSMGSKNWYRLSAMLPGELDVIQIELWPERGAFRGGSVKPGIYQLTGDDLSYATCGVCARALADRGMASQREYFAIAGTVEIKEVAPTAGAPFVATVRDMSFAEVDSNHSEIEGGCSLDLEAAEISGSVQLMSGTGGGFGGGGGGGSGGGAGGCVTTVGD